MKFLLSTIDYPPFKGGVSDVYFNLNKYWPEPENFFVLDNNDKKLVNNDYLFIPWLPSFRSLYSEIKNNKIDHVLVGQILPLGTVALFLSKILKFKYSVIMHGMDFSFAVKSKRKKILTRLILNNAEKIICTNSYLSGLISQFLKNLDNNKIKTINPGIDIEKYKSISQAEINELQDRYNLNGKRVIISIGRLVKRKGFNSVISCLPEIFKKFPNTIYVLIGRGEESDNLKRLARDKKIEKNVIFINDADDRARDCWLKLADMFIMVSREISGDFEGFGIVYLEANLAGKPVIAGDSGGVKDAVISGYSGILVDPNNNSEIAQAIKKLLSDGDFSYKLGQNGQKRAIKDFSWEEQAKRFYNFLK